MNRFVVLAACVCASSAQFLAPATFGGVIGAAPARAFAPAPVQSSQFHAQDEFGQYTFGHSGGPSARTESRDAFGVVTGSYQQIDANGLIQTVNYRADPLTGFQVVGTNTPVGPAVPEVAPLAAPVFNPEPLVAPTFNPAPLVAPVDTPEVAAAKAEHAAAHAAIAASRKRRSAQVIAAAPAFGLAHGLPLAGLYAGAPADIVANIAPAVPATAAVAPAVVPAALSPALAYNAVSNPAAAREAILTTIKLNPGHATFYRVD